MERAVLTITPENIITIWLMAIVLWLVAALGAKLYRNATGKGEASSSVTGTTGGVPSVNQWALYTGGASIPL